MIEIIKDCEQAAHVAAKILIENQKRITVREKSPKDLVTEADVASQEAICDFLTKRYPEFNFVGEENSDTLENHESDYCWIVDPLDGTTNYVHGLDNFCISIALRKKRRNNYRIDTRSDPSRNFSCSSGEWCFSQSGANQGERNNQDTRGLGCSEFPRKCQSRFSGNTTVCKCFVRMPGFEKAWIGGVEHVLCRGREAGWLLGNFCKVMGCGSGSVNDQGIRRRHHEHSGRSI